MAGCFGKLPQRADFVQRDLSATFVDVWDTWLQRAMTMSKAALGEDWLRLYVVSPIWCFVLGREAAGGVAHAGAVAPSVDQVGRYYPLTIAAPVDTRDGGPPFDAWFDRAAECLLDVLEEIDGPERFFGEVRAMGAPTIPDSPCCLDPYGPPQPVDLASSFAGSRAGLWWTDGGEAIGASTLVCPRGLPPAAAAAAFLDGEWARHGWREGAPHMPASMAGTDA
jgi:type VI secretion system protein ImpM